MKKGFSFIKFQNFPFARKKVLQLNQYDMTKINAYKTMENTMNQQIAEQNNNIILQNEFVKKY